MMILLLSWIIIATLLLISISWLTKYYDCYCTERARTAKLVGASQECQVIAYAESVLDKTTKTQKAGEVLYTELENISFAAEIKKMKGDDMLLAEVRFYFILFYW